MNFAYNFITNIEELKKTLFSQFIQDKSKGINLDMTVHKHPNGDREERFYHEGEDDVLCRILYNFTNGRIVYYEQKSSKHNNKEHKPAYQSP